MSAEIERISFIGLGTMGLPMSTRLIEAGYVVSGFDIDKSAEQALATRGGRLGFPNPAAASLDADLVICSLPNSSHVEEALTGPHGAFSGSPPGTLILDMSTISPNTSRSLGVAATKAGLLFADGPVSGSSEGAEAGTLTIMVGAEIDVFEALGKPLSVLGRNVIHVGPVGSGESIKLLNNLLAAVNMAAVAEAYALAAKAGVDFATFHRVVSTATGDSWMLRNRFPAIGIGPEGPVDREYAPGFATRLMRKDLDLVREFATEVGSTVPLAAAVREMCEAVVINGWGELDFSALAKLYELTTGL
jgi:3-hydroxyisobutyrate dehydrogenase